MSASGEYEQLRTWAKRCGFGALALWLLAPWFGLVIEWREIGWALFANGSALLVTAGILILFWDLMTEVRR